MNTASPHSSRAAFRSPHMDMLRGIAVFGILLVNVWSFVWGYEYLRYGVLPQGATLSDRIAVFMTALIAEQKFYPIFAFLFGAGFALHTKMLRRRCGDWRSARKAYGRRLRWLLGCGVLHGTLIWFGDILTLYAIAGFCILRVAGARLRNVRAIFWCWFIVWAVVVLVNTLLALSENGGAPVGLLPSEVEQARAVRAIYTEGGIIDIALQRLADYLAVNAQSVLLLPHIMVLFLLGIISVRLGWLTRPWRHAALWRRVRFVGFAIGIPFNLAWAGAALAETTDPLHLPAYTLVLYALLPVGGSCLAAAYAASVMLAGQDARRQLGTWLAPVGRMALTNYLMQSVLGTLLLQGSGLGLGAALPHAGLLLLAGAIMLLQIFLSRWWLHRHRQGPVEALYRRHADAGGIHS